MRVSGQALLKSALRYVAFIVHGATVVYCNYLKLHGADRDMTRHKKAGCEPANFHFFFVFKLVGEVGLEPTKA